MLTLSSPKIRTTRRFDAECSVSLAKRRVWFASEGDDNGGGENDDGAEEKKYTQADFDRVLGTAKRDAKNAAIEAEQKRIREALGLGESDTLESVADLLKAQREHAEAEKSELQKANEAKAKLEADLKAKTDEFDTFKAKMEADRRVSARDGAVKAALAKENAKADKVFALIAVQHAEALAGVLKDDGTVDEGKVKTLIETARKAYPEDFTVGRGTPSHAGGRAANPNLQKARERASANNQRNIRG